MHSLADKRHMMVYCLASALPLMLMALVFNFPLATGGRYFPGTDLALLGYLMHAEFLAAASGILVILPLLFPAGAHWVRHLRMAVFIVFGYACAWIAYSVDGTSGMLSYALLVFLTFGGGMLLVFDWLSGVTRAFLSLLRWSVAVFAYMSLQLYFNLDADITLWKNTRAVVTFGALFFYTLTACEVLVYPWLTWYLERNVRQEHQLERRNAAVAIS